jgi:hypothetical protein
MRRVSEEALFYFVAIDIATMKLSLCHSLIRSVILPGKSITVILFFEDCIYIGKNSMRVVLLLFLILSANALFAQQIDSLKKPAVDTTVSTKVDVEASVDAKHWIDHLSSILRPYIEKAAKKGMKPGTYTVQVKFLVERDGSINYVEALNDPGYNLAKGAVRAVKTGPRWKAGQENGKSVRSYHTQPITFVIQIE